jgi:hypothetical protein
MNCVTEKLPLELTVSGVVLRGAKMPVPDGEQFVNLVHYGGVPTPPHTVDHPMKDIYEKGDWDDNKDRRFSNDVIFMADEDNKDMGTAIDYAQYAHVYRVPSSRLSVEMFGDDDRPSRSLEIVQQKSPQAELWSGVPASREDAVTNNRVVRYVNAVESPGSTSYIVPKSLIKSGDVEYLGTDRTDWGQIVVADLVDEDD